MAKKFAAFAVVSSLVLATELAVACTGKPLAVPSVATSANGGKESPTKDKEVNAQTRQTPAPASTPTPNIKATLAPGSQTPKPTGYIASGDISIKVTISDSKQEWFKNLSVEFTGGLGGQQVLDFVSKMEEAILRFWTNEIVYPETGKKSRIGSDPSVLDDGAPFPGRVKLLLDKHTGDAFMLVYRRLERLWCFKSYDGSFYNCSGGNDPNKDIGFTFLWDATTMTWKYVDGSIAVYNRWPNSDYWDQRDIASNFLIPLVGVSNFGYSVVDASIPEWLILSTPDGVQRLNISGLESAGAFHDDQITEGGSWAGYYWQAVSVGYGTGSVSVAWKEAEQLGAQPYLTSINGNIVRTSRGWVFADSRFGAAPKGVSFYVQRNSEETWKQNGPFWPEDGFPLNFYIETIQGGPNSPFGERDVVSYISDRRTVLLDEEELFR